MKRFHFSSAAIAMLLALSACTTIPKEPTVTVIPAPYKPFEVFQADDRLCRDYARQRLENDGPEYRLQRLYNISYQQCMYSKGNQVPGYAVAPTYQAPPPPPPP